LRRRGVVDAAHEVAVLECARKKDVLPEDILPLDGIVDVEDNLGAVSLQLRPLPGKKQLPADLDAGSHAVDLVYGQPIAGDKVSRVKGAEGVLVVPPELALRRDERR